MRILNKCCIKVTCFALVLSAPYLIYAQKNNGGEGELTWGDGLEVPMETTVPVAIENLNNDAIGLGLKPDVIRNKVESRLRKNGIIPCSDEEFGPGYKDFVLIISVEVCGKAHSCSVDFMRKSSYYVNDKCYWRVGTYFNKHLVGTHAGDPENVLRGLMDLVDMFSSAFLESNKN